MTIQQLEQLDLGHRRLCLAILVTLAGIDAATKDFNNLTLIKFRFLAHIGNKPQVPMERGVY